MPEKPDNEMERMLERYAEQRRSEPEVRVHPATRRMLQGEVKRAYAKRPRKKAWFSVRSWRRFWAYAAVTAVLAFIVADLVRPRSPIQTEMEMAQASSDTTVPVQKLRKVPSQEPATPSLKRQSADLPGEYDLSEAELTDESSARLGRILTTPKTYFRPESSELAAAAEGGEPPGSENAMKLESRAPGAGETPMERRVAVEQAVQIRPEDEVVAYDLPALGAVPNVTPSPMTNPMERESEFLSYASTDREAAAERTNAARAAAREAWEARILALAGARTQSMAVSTAIPQPGINTNVELRTRGFGLPSETVGLKTVGTPGAAGVEAKQEEENLPAATAPSNLSFALREGVQYGVGQTTLTNLGAAHRMWFLQMTNPAAAGVAGSVLPRFTVERIGEEVRFVDMDGSIYQGEIKKQDGKPQFEPVDGQGSVMELLGGAMLKSAGADDLNITNAVVYNFTVQGTNRTLDAKVAVTGKFVERTNAPALRGLSGVAAGQVSDATSQTRLGSLPKTKAAIVGAAVIGETNTVLFKALAPEP